MTKLMGNGEGHTVLILTDAESRLIRHALDRDAEARQKKEAVDSFNAGIARGTAKLQQEFADEQREKKAKRT